MRFIYSLFVCLYSVTIRIVSPFYLKAKLWVEGRENGLEIIKAKLHNSNAPIIWFHCASLGEFEQGRPLMQQIKLHNPEIKILLTFFSPSGYQVRKNSSGADWVFYLPSDTVSNAYKFIEIVKPQKAIFVKYEFWFNYLQALSQKNIPTYFISVNVRPDQYFFKWYGKWALNQLKNVSHFFVQNEASCKLLSNAGILQCTIAGDTRFDRVLAISKEAKIYPLIEKFCENKSIIVAGSTWREDELLLTELLKMKSSKYKDLKLIIAPHEIDPTNLNTVEALFLESGVVRYSQAQTDSFQNKDVLIIDNIGMLSSLYNYSTIAYIGGGFGKGIHNILEAAVFGKPVLFGPKFQKFEEAKELVKRGGATVISNSFELQTAVTELLSNKKKYREQCSISETFVHDNLGAVEKIYLTLNE